MAAAKLMKLELMYSCAGKKLMVRMLFFAIALATLSVLYAVYDAAPCAYLSDCPDDFIVDFARPRWQLTRTISVLSARDQAQPNQSELKVSPYRGLGINSHPQIKMWERKTWREKVEFYSAIFRDLAARGVLRPRFKALCVGASSGISVAALRENGLLDATGVDDRRSFVSKKAQDRYLPFAEKSFDFVFAGSFDRATVPALLASEIERTLKADGVAVMLVSSRRPNMGKPSNPMHSLSPVVALFKSSDVIHVTTSGTPNYHETTVIALRKRASGGSKPMGLIKDNPRSKQNRSSIQLTQPLTKNHSNDVVHVSKSGSPNSSKTAVNALRKQPSGGSRLGLIKNSPRSKQNRSSIQLAEPLTKNHSKDVIHVSKSGSPNSSETAMNALRKRPSGGSKAPLQGLIKDSPRSKQNSSVIKLAEPLTKNHSKAIYLPNLKDISDRRRHIYVEIGGNSHSNNNKTIDADAGWFLASYPKQNQTFDTYVLNSHANLSEPESKPRRSLNSIKQVVGDDGNSRTREQFEIAGWLSEMRVSDEDFVVVKMGFEHVTREKSNKKGGGFMRLIEELFMQCSSELSEEVNVECLQFLQILRDNGVFIHRW